MQMAVAHPPLPQEQVEKAMPNSHPTTMATPEKRHISTLLAVMLGVMAVFPFVVQYLPNGLRQYLELLFR